MRDLLIIGGGIAGQTAALYASLKRMDFALITKELGGQFLKSGRVVNYPGIVETAGVDFGGRMREQMKANDIDPVEGVEAAGIEKTRDGFLVHTNRETYEARTVIIATGATHRKLNVPGEERYANKGVTYCAICDGPLFSGMDIAIIGGGDSALGAVDFTKDIASRIYLLNKENEWKAHEYLVEKARNNGKVEMITGADTREIKGDKLVSGLRYSKDGVEHELAVRGVIIEIGRAPNTDFVKGFLKLDNREHIEIDCQTRTSVAGIFAAGDCASGREYQYVIAAGQGCMALLKAARYLAGK